MLLNYSTATVKQLVILIKYALTVFQILQHQVLLSTSAAHRVQLPISILPRDALLPSLHKPLTEMLIVIHGPLESQTDSIFGTTTQELQTHSQLQTTLITHSITISFSPLWHRFLIQQNQEQHTGVQKTFSHQLTMQILLTALNLVLTT